MQFRAGGQCPADIPGVGRAADRAVDQVHGVGDRVEHDARAAEHAGPLADRPGQAVLFAFHLERLRRSPTFAMDLRDSFDCASRMSDDRIAIRSAFIVLC